MKKKSLINIVKKYYLDGITFKDNSGFNPVLFSIQNKECLVRIKSSDKSLMVLLNSGIEIDDCDLVIPESKNFINYLSAFGDDISVTPMKSGLEYERLSISDENNMSGILALGSIEVVDNDTNVNLPEEFDVVIKLTTEEIDRFIKARKALSDAQICAFNVFDDCVDVVINYSMQKHNTDTLTVKFNSVTTNSEIDTISFSLDPIQSIFQNNLEFESGTISILGKGLMVIEFAGEGYGVKYLLKPIETI